MQERAIPYSEITVLYVEDEATTREQVARVLRTRGYNLIIATDGQQGLEAYLQHHPDMVLTDIMMPNMGGLEMARKIRAIMPESQIVCMTAFSEAEFMIEAIDIGINQFVLKPVDFSKLLAALDRCQTVVELQLRQRTLEEENLRGKKMEAVCILAGGMAHDFNNLLQIILGYVSLARMNVEPGSKPEQLLAIAEKSTETARELGNRLITFAKRGYAAMQPARIEPVLREAVQAECTGRSVTCSFNLADNLPMLPFDIPQLRQTFAHLATNACEAMPPDGTLLVSAALCHLAPKNALTLEPGDYLQIVFSDSGCGIAPENLPKIFDPYFTTKDTVTQKGVGLGLALSHSIIRRHRGQIRAESIPGTGTSIQIYLPVNTKQEAQTAS